MDTGWIFNFQIKCWPISTACGTMICGWVICIMEEKYQVLEPLTAEEYAALKASIAELGIMQPVIVDENNNTIDGHHRRRAAAELGIKDKDIPKVILAGLSETEKRREARRLNSARRHYSATQRRKLIQDALQDAPERSDRQIAGDLGVSPSTVGAIRKEMEAAGELSKMDRRTVSVK